MLGRAGEYLADNMTINQVLLRDGIYTKEMFQQKNTLAQAAFSEKTIEALVKMSVADFADGEAVNVVLPKAYMDYGEKLSLLSARNRQAVHVFQEEYKWYQFPYYYEDPDDGFWYEQHFEGLTWTYSDSDGYEDSYFYPSFWFSKMYWTIVEAAEDAIEDLADATADKVEEIWQEKKPAYEEIEMDYQ